MTDFLEFLNSAADDELRELPGIRASLAKQIISSRPIATLDEAQQVKGLDEKLLAKLQLAYAERSGLTPPAADPTVEAALETPAGNRSLEKRPLEAEESTRASGPGFLSRLGRAFINLVRAFVWLVLIAAVVGGIGAGVYFGIPYLYERFVRPVELNAVQIRQIATQQAVDLAMTSAEVTGIRGQLGSLETRLGRVESTIADHSLTLGQLEEMQAALDEALKTQNTELLAEVDYRVKLTRAIELLSRGRLYLSQSNFGMARQDVLSARDVLSDLQDVAPGDEIGPLEAVISRLDLALGNLPGYPVIAANDLEIAWQVLIDGLPASAEALATPLRVFPTSVATATESATPTPTPAETATPTALP